MSYITVRDLLQKVADLEGVIQEQNVKLAILKMKAAKFEEQLNQAVEDLKELEQMVEGGEESLDNDDENEDEDKHM